MSRVFSIGVDLGGTNLRVAAYANGVNFLESIVAPTQLSEGREHVVREMCEAIKTLASRNYGEHRLMGIGIGTPGPLELPAGILRNPPNLPGWDGFNLRFIIESTLGRPVEIESDANLAALAEEKLGSGHALGVSSLCAITLGTGVGSGIILNGSIWHGATGMGGEAGHIIVQDQGGAACGCGGFGCLEQYASASAIVRMATEALGAIGAPTTSQEVALLAHNGAPAALRVFENVGHSLAIGLTALINTLNLPLFVISGGVCEAWDLFAPTMFRELLRRSYVYRLTEPTNAVAGQYQTGKTFILGAQLGSSAGLLGACLLPLQRRPNRSNASGTVFIA